MTITEPASTEVSDRGFRVGDWLVEPAWNRISIEDRTRKLEPRVMRLLVELAGAPGRVFTRDELLDAVWTGLNVNEDALSRAISQLRQALADDSRNPRYIRTVHKGGYCLVASVGSGTGTQARAPFGTVGKRGVGYAVTALLAVVAIGIGVTTRESGPSATTAAGAALVPVPITSDPGREIDPSLSRDGRKLAFAAQTDAGFDLFWRTIGDDRANRLTRDGRFGGYPTWSPGGGQIAFLRTDAGRSTISIVDAATGKSETVLSLGYRVAGLDWSPDGTTLAFGDNRPGRPHSIVTADLATRSTRTVTQTPSSDGDEKPAYSPDGRKLAFLRDAGLGLSRIFVVDLADPQSARAATRRPENIRGFDWEPGGASLIYSADQGGRFGLHRIPADGGGTAEAIRTEGGDLFNPSISSAGRLAVEAVERDSDIWRAAIDGSSAAPLIRSTFDDYDAVPSADGARIAFVSGRSGAPEIWLADSAGGSAARLTRFGGANLGGPLWSPDGRRIAVQARLRGYAETYVVGLGGERPIRVAAGGGVHRVPIGWTANKNQLIVAHGTGAGWQVLRHDLGSGRSSLLTSVPARLAVVAADGRSVVIVTADGTKLARVELGSGRTEIFRLPPSLPSAAAIRSTQTGLFLTAFEPSGTAVYRVTPARGSAAVKRVAVIPTYGHVAIAADGGSILFTRDRETSNDIVLIDLSRDN